MKIAGQYANENGLILEKWIEGPQLSTESIIWDYQSYLCGVADRNYERLSELYPYIVEDGGETPSRFSPAINDELTRLITRAAKAIGLKNGSLKGDIVLGKEGLYIIEVAARLSGGYFSTITIPSVYGIPIVEEVIKIALNKKPDLPCPPIQNSKWQANRFLFLPPGRINAIIGLPTPDSEIEIFDIYVKKNELIPQITDHTRRCGMAMVISDSRERAIQKCKRVLSKIKVKVEANTRMQ
jgi:biotin carboxylase